MKNKGIEILSGFKVKSNTPIDERFVRDTFEELEEIENKYEGMITVCREDKTVYVYLDGTFLPIGSSTSNNQFTYSFDFKLASDENLAENYIIRK